MVANTGYLGIKFLLATAFSIFGLILPSYSEAQTLTSLHSFTALDSLFANEDGSYPTAGPAFFAGALYGTCSQGGENGRGTLFKINTDGTGFIPIYAFTTTDPGTGTNGDGAFPLSGLVFVGSTLYGTASAGGAAANGTIFKVNSDGSGFVTLHAFSASDPTTSVNNDGAAPWATLIASGNTLFGTATSGGTGGSGTVFKLNTDGSGFMSLHSFSALAPTSATNSDGGNPLGALTISGNTLYGTTYRGGSLGTGTVFKINIDGSAFTVLHNNDGGSRGGLVVAGNQLYGTTESGGTFGGGTVFKLATDGTGFTNLQNFASSPANGPWGGLVLVSNVLYGTTYGSGDSAMGSIFSINPDGTAFSNLYSFTGVNDGAHPQGDLILSNGQIFGTTSEGGGAGDGTVFKLSPGNGSGSQLTISIAGKNVVLSWPVAPASSLQSTTNLGTPASWTNVTQTPTVVGGMNFLTNAISDQQRFYRLSQ